MAPPSGFAKPETCCAREGWRTLPHGRLLSTQAGLRAFKAALRSDSSETPGTILGNYRLLRIIGEGGFSTVWLADQLAPLQRKVAVKVLKLGMDTEEISLRFERERQSLAMMEHPNIARIFDAGATGTGRPFFVMELVRGVAITCYCDALRLGIEARIHLFITVCQAVLHAHQRGFIHRDLKPSNILVAPNGGTPVVKVIDFGIAKTARTAPLSDDTPTRQQAFLGTPAYTSPEQLTLQDAPVDARSDLYSLGALLHELVSGCLPDGLDNGRQMPPPSPPHHPSDLTTAGPSACLASLPASTLAAIARHRGLVPPALCRRLRGDLDRIIMHCLERRPEHRYQSVALLTADLQHHLSSEPISARPQGTFYLLHKSLQRHRVACLALGSVFLSLAIGTLTSTWQAFHAREAEQQAMMAELEQSRLRLAETRLRRHAEAQALALRHLAYASDMNLANQALAGGNLGRAIELLDRQRPADGKADLRGWEWRYLWQSCRSESAEVLNALPVQAQSLEITWDGSWIASTGKEESSLGLLRFPGGTVLALPLPAAHGSILAAYSPAEPLAAILFSTGEARRQGCAHVILWNPLSRTQRGSWDIPHRSLGGDRSLAFSRDGKRLLAGLGSDPVICSVQDGQVLESLRNDDGGATAIASDFSRFAVALPDGRVRIRDLATGAERCLAERTPDGIGALAFAADGRLLASAGAGGETTAKVWDASTGALLGTLVGHLGPVQRLLFSADGTRLATASRDETIRLWNLATMSLERRLLGHDGPVTELGLLPDGRTLVSAAKDGSIRLWAMDDRRADPHQLLPLRVGAWRFDHAGSGLITIQPSGQVDHWTLGNPPRPRFLSMIGPGNALLQPDTLRLARRLPFCALLARDGTLQVWDWERGAMILELKPGALPATPGCLYGFGEDDRSLLFALVDPLTGASGVCEWDLEERRITRQWPGPAGGSIPRGGLTANGAWCLADWSDRLQSRAAPRAGRTLAIRLRDGHTQEITGLSLGEQDSLGSTREGSLLVLPAAPSPTRVWDLGSMRQVHILPSSHCAAVSPDELRIVTGAAGAESLRLWDAGNGEQVLSIPLRQGVLLRVGFSPDGGTLAGWTQSQELHLWRAPSLAAIEDAERADRSAGGTRAPWTRDETQRDADRRPAGPPEEDGG